jgi:hypothetical protein
MAPDPLQRCSPFGATDPSSFLLGMTRGFGELHERDLLNSSNPLARLRERGRRGAQRRDGG